jgi:tRNA A58 N-methylase Trm61
MQRLAILSLLLTCWSGDKLTPEAILSALNLQQGATVCEIGAGDGELSIAAARFVGPNGRVYTSELGDTRLKTLREKTNAVKQITVVKGDSAKTNFPESGCDAVFMRDVYHHFSDPESMNASIRSSLRSGGRIAIVDFTPSTNEAARPSDRDQDGTHGVRPETVAREMQNAGFELVSSSDPPSGRWFMVVFAQPVR